MVSNQELRFRARTRLGSQIFSNDWLYALVVSLIVGFAVGVSTSFVVGIVLYGIIEYGHSKYYLLRARGIISYDQLMVATDGIKDDAVSNMILGLLTSVFIFLWSLLFFIPGVIKSYSYSMAYLRA